MAKRAVRLVSNLFHICTGSKNKNSIKNLWRIIQVLVQSVVYKFVHTCIFSWAVLSDIIKILRLLQLQDQWELLLQVSEEYKENLSKRLALQKNHKTLIVRVNYYVEPRMFNFASITDKTANLKIKTLGASQITCGVYVRALRAVTSFLAIRCSSEFNWFSSKTQKENHTIKQNEYYFCKI